MPERLTDGPGPYLRPFRLWVAPEQGYPRTLETLLLMQELCLVDDGDAWWHASTPRVAHWRSGIVQIGVN